RELRRVALARGWEIRRFERPVALQRRVSARRAVPAAVAVGAVLLVAAVAVGGWWGRPKPAPPRSWSPKRSDRTDLLRGEGQEATEPDEQQELLHAARV